MSEEQNPAKPWTAEIAGVVERHDRRGGFLVLFSDYRPELAHGIARALGCAVADFRKEVMAPKGWQAGQLPLADIDAYVAEKSAAGGVVVQNVEALLSTKSEAERSLWLAEFLTRDWPAPVLLPLFLFASAAPEGASRVVAVSAAETPEETLMMRLWSTR